MWLGLQVLGNPKPLYPHPCELIQDLATSQPLNTMTAGARRVGKQVGETRVLTQHCRGWSFPIMYVYVIQFFFFEESVCYSVERESASTHDGSALTVSGHVVRCVRTTFSCHNYMNTPLLWKLPKIAFDRSNTWWRIWSKRVMTTFFLSLFFLITL